MQIISRGAQTEWGDGGIVEQCSGAYQVKSASVAMTGAGDGKPADAGLPHNDLTFDQRVKLVDLNTGEPIADRHYRAVLEDGQVVEGRTDAQGHTQILQSDVSFGRYSIEALDD